VIPTPGRADVLHELHEAHPGSTRMKRLAHTFVWWPGIDKDIEMKVSCFLECQSVQSSPPLSPLQPLSWTSCPWSRVHVDLAGPFMGHMFLLLIDAPSKWMEVHLLSSTSSTGIIRCLHRIFSTVGLPEVLVTDNGPNFVSKEFDAFLGRNGVKHKTSAPYHPATNGLVERAVQTFKRGIKKMTVGSIQDKISRFLFAYRNTPQCTTGVTPAELLLGRKPRSPLDLIKPDLHKRVEKEQSRQKDVHDIHAKGRLFVPGDTVYIRNFDRGSSNIWLPGNIIQTMGPLSFQIALSDGRIVRRHINCICKRCVELTKDFSDGLMDTTSNSSEPVPLQTVSPQSDTSESEQSEPEQDLPAAVSTPEGYDSPQRRYPRRNRRPPDRYGY